MAFYFVSTFAIAQTPTKQPEEDILLHASSTQENPGWALDRIDEPGTTYVDDGTYEYTNDGSGRTIICKTLHNYRLHNTNPTKNRV
jgi:hypothetical protein